MTRRLFGIVAFFAIAMGAPAMAADMPVKALSAPVVAAYSWNGFYVGAHVGYASAYKQWFDPIAGIDLVSFTSDGFVGGGQVGYNWQTGPWVLGIEADASWSHLQKGIIAVLIGQAPFIAFDPLIANPVPTRFGATIDHFGSVAGRIGHAWDRWLVYLKGGAAWAHDTYRVVHLIGGRDVLVASKTDTRWGWMVGAGLEYGLTQNWSAKIEYNFMDFGTDRVAFSRVDGGVPSTFPLDIDQHIHVVKIGINYRFGVR
jgi:outer membrane immunogenic protein